MKPEITLKQLTEAGFSSKVLDVLNGGPIQGDLTPGELFCLSILAPERVDQLIKQEHMPFAGLIELYHNEDNSEITEQTIASLLRKKAIGFDEKSKILDMENDVDQDLFNETLPLISNLDQCSMIFTIIDMSELLEPEKEINFRTLIEMIKKFNPDIDYWIEMYEDSNSYKRRIVCIKEMKTLASQNPTFKHWAAVYYYSLAGSEWEKDAIENMHAFTPDFDEIADVYIALDDESNQKKNEITKRLKAVAKFDDWYNRFEPSEYDGLSSSRINELCFAMMMELNGEFSKYFDVYLALKEIAYMKIIAEKMPQLKAKMLSMDVIGSIEEHMELYNDVDGDYQLDVMKKMMNILDNTKN
ncbi:MAG: hypothetical protein NT085_01705 [candidate division SR1 bacterium]|nr:hypothetical protein [candidate division SR1 bacterium]